MISSSKTMFTGRHRATIAPHRAKI
jgi:hypothetical protein